MSKNIFESPLVIKETHLDSFGHVNNATYLSIFEQARWDLITQNGYGLDKIKATGLGPTILEINIKFLKELRLREKVIITTEMISYKGKVGMLKQQILRQEELCCVAEFVIAFFNLRERKLVLPTPEWLQAVGYDGKV